MGNENCAPELQKSFDKHDAEHELLNKMQDARFEMLKDEIIKRGRDFSEGWDLAMEWIAEDARLFRELMEKQSIENDEILKLLDERRKDYITYNEQPQ